MSTEIESLELRIASNSKEAVNGIDALTRSLLNLKAATQNVGLSGVATGIGKVADATKKASASNEKASKSFTDLFHKVSVVAKSFKAVGKSIYSFVKASSDHTESVNLFTVSLGKYADEAKGYAESVSDIMGINTTEWLESQGIFMTLATGFGVASDRAQIMSQNLTQLGYDLSSFFNLDLDDAMQKLQSGLAGELEPLRRIGYDLSQAKLEATALELGIDKSVSSMTQAEKAQLRYYAIMTQVTTAQGDMARTLDAPANQMRILKAQFQMTAISIGNIFIPALQAILPYAIAVTKVVREMADGLASLVGFEPTGVESAIASVGEVANDTSSALEEGAESAKKLKSYMLGFDELNVISPNRDDSAEDASGFEFTLPEYDFLSGTTNEKIEGIITKIKELFEPLTKLIEKTVGWAKELDLEPISKAFEELGSTVEAVGGTIFETLSDVYNEVLLPLAEWSIEEGLPTAIGLLAEAFAFLGEALSWVHEEIMLPLSEWLIGEGLPTATNTLAEAFRFLGEVLPPVLEGIKELEKDLEPIVEWIGEVVIVALEGFGSIFKKLAEVCSEKGPEITSIFTGIGDVLSKWWVIVKPIADGLLFVFDLFLDAFGDLAAINFTYLVDVISSVIDIFAGFANGDWAQVWGGVVGIFEACWTSIIDTILAWWDFMVELYSPVAQWFNTHVIQPVGNFFEGLWESVSGFFVNLWLDIVGVWNTVATWFNDTVVTPVVHFFLGVWTSVFGFFKSLWEDIVGVWLGATAWFDETVIQPIVGVFEGVTLRIGEFFEGSWLIVQAVWLIASTWFDENVVQPIVGVFEGVWTSVSGFFSSLWDDIVTEWLLAAAWFDANVVQPIVEFFRGVWTSVSGFFSSLWEDIVLNWELAATWFDETVVQPLVGFFEGLQTSVSGFFKSLWEDICLTWKKASAWFDETVIQPTVGFFITMWANVLTIFTSLLRQIKETWQKVSTWFDETIIEPVETAFEESCESIGGFFSALWLGIRRGVAGAMNGVISSIETAINWVIKGINDLIGGFDKIVQWAADVLGKDWGGMTLISKVSFSRITVPTYADGGFPEQGQMFIAREAGAEMVGNIGRRTAVANNDQIVSGIAGGVAEANEEQNALLREQNSLLRAILEKDSGTYLDGKSLTHSVEKYQRERGRVLITGGVV